MDMWGNTNICPAFKRALDDTGILNDRCPLNTLYPDNAGYTGYGGWNNVEWQI
jgi:hypothetical protein